MEFFWVLEYKSKFMSVYLMEDPSRAAFSIHDAVKFRTEAEAMAFRAEHNKDNSLSQFLPTEHGYY